MEYDMDDKLNALDKLIEAVEAGTLDSVWHGCSSRRGHWAYDTGLDATQRNLAWQASHGSLDAALALHEALLPGWKYSLSNDLLQHGGPCEPAAVWDGMNCYSGGFPGEAVIQPARAWLLAVLKAYRSIQDDNR